jgi:DNA polymerase I-like protein with 3'-5' exonuclease and polymerase domains
VPSGQSSNSLAPGASHESWQLHCNGFPQKAVSHFPASKNNGGGQSPVALQSATSVDFWQLHSCIFSEIFSDKSKTLVAQNYKFDFKMMKKYGMKIQNKIFDTMLAHYVINADGKHGMDAFPFVNQLDNATERNR